MGQDAFPKYLMWVGGNQTKFLSFSEAATALNNSHGTFFGQYVLQEDFSVALMIDEERIRISDAAFRMRI